MSVDTEFSLVARDSDFPSDLVAQKPVGAFPGPGQLGFTLGMGSASDCMASLPTEMVCFGWGLLVGSVDNMDPLLNQAVSLFFWGMSIRLVEAM